ncbi:MAG TPA: alpha/beta fold hydrolase, partial [Agromyces sp.]
MRRRHALLAGLTAAGLLVLTGCTVPNFLQPEPARSEPTGERVAAELEPFYSQVLEWERCGEFQCTTATAPLDWSDPSAGETELALVRQTARGGERIGSLLVNPGGPGASGYDFIAESIDYAVGEPLQERYDVVGFDPRGVGRSTPVTCFDAAEMDDYLFGIPEAERGSDAWIAEVGAAAQRFGAACAEGTGELLANVDTVSAARDLDLLRAVLGDDELHYLGYSYGTLLGATYAELYPERVGRLVLDGAIDPSASNDEVTQAQA